MNKVNAKRLACRIASGLLDQWIGSDWSIEGDVPDEDNNKVEAAMREIADEMHRRSENLEWPEWWGGPRV